MGLTPHGKLNIYSGKITGTNTYVINIGSSTCTANLYGGTITGGSSYTINNVGTLTIGGKAKVESDKQYAVYNNSDNAVVVVKDHAVISNSSGSGIDSGSGKVTVEGGTISGNNYGVENKKSVDVSGGNITGGQYGIFMYNDTATLSMTGNPTISGTTAALRLYTSSGTTVDNAKVVATGYTGDTLKVEEQSVSEGAYAIKVDDGSKGKFTLSDSSGYQYAHKNGGLMIHEHSYTYTANSNVLTESCSGCDHTATATVSVSGGPFYYTGSAFTPATVVYSQGWVGGDLTVNYSSNTNVGTATASITKNSKTAQTTFSIVKATQTAPGTNEGYTIKYAEETLTVTSNYEVSTKNDGTGTAVNSGASVTPGATLYIRKAETSTADPSGWTAITIPARPAAPSGVNAENETITGASDGKITGVTAAMEYSKDSGATWTACAGTTVTGLTPGSYQVRTKATNSAFASEAATVTISAGAAKTYTLTVTAPTFDPVPEGYTQPQAKAVTIHSTGNSNATISAVTVSDPGKFTIGGSGNTVTAGGSITTWTIQPAAGLSVGTHTATITVTYDGSATATAQVSFTVRNTTPTIHIDYQNGTLTGFETGSKYTIDGTEVTPTNGSISIKDYFGKTVSIVKKHGLILPLYHKEKNSDFLTG